MMMLGHVHLLWLLVLAGSALLATGQRATGAHTDEHEEPEVSVVAPDEANMHSLGSWLRRDIIEDPPVVNTIGEREFPEKYTKRCGKSTRVSLRDEQEPTMIVWRSGGPETDVHLSLNASVEQLLEAGFDKSKSTIVFVHGWTQSPQSPYLRAHRELIERLGGCQHANYLVFDWHKTSQGMYGEVAARSSGIANYLALYVEKLIEAGQDRKLIHLIGHSLGVQIVGFAGKRIEPRIGRITGLDPAGPCFGRFSLNGNDDRLTRGDALQVDIYHYDEFAGYNEPVGDIDLYVNDGKNQPGCPRTTLAIATAIFNRVAGRDAVTSPSHTRSALVSSVELEEGKCQQVAYECSNYKAFREGRCSECGPDNANCFLMTFPFQYKSHPEPEPLRVNELGANSTKSRQMYVYVPPNGDYCSNHYRILIKFDRIGDLAEGLWRLKMQVNFESSSGKMEHLKVETKTKAHQSSITHLLLTQRAPFKVVSIDLAEFERIDVSDDKPQTLKLFYKISSVHVDYMSNIDPEVRANYSSRLCSKGISKSWNHLKLDDCSN